jgi:hypothetical protein
MSHRQVEEDEKDILLANDSIDGAIPKPVASDILEMGIKVPEDGMGIGRDGKGGPRGGRLVLKGKDGGGAALKGATDGPPLILRINERLSTQRGMSEGQA